MTDRRGYHLPPDVIVDTSIGELEKVLRQRRTEVRNCTRAFVRPLIRGPRRGLGRVWCHAVWLWLLRALRGVSELLGKRYRTFLRIDGVFTAFDISDVLFLQPAGNFLITPDFRRWLRVHLLPIGAMILESIVIERARDGMIFRNIY